MSAGESSAGPSSSKSTAFTPQALKRTTAFTPDQLRQIKQGEAAMYNKMARNALRTMRKKKAPEEKREENLRHNVEERICQLCGKIPSLKDRKRLFVLISHALTHDEQLKLFRCPTCGWRSRRKGNMRLHISTTLCTGEPIEDPDEDAGDRIIHFLHKCFPGTQWSGRIDGMQLL